MSDTIFGKIISGDIPSEFIYEDEHCIAINDINPQAPTHVLIIPKAPVHVLVIPKRGIARLVDAQPDDQMMLGHLLLAAGNVARQLGVDNAFRLIINNGEGAGQTVFHLHLHILAGSTFSEGHMAG